MRRARYLAASFVLAGAIAGGTAGASPAVVVDPGQAMRTAALPAGATVVLAPGPHAGFEVDGPITVRGAPGAFVLGEIVVRADGARVADVTVVGGENGITVQDADGVVLERVHVIGGDMHGIEVIGATARISDCLVHGPRTPYGQAIEIRNSMYRGVNVVEGCTISDVREGVVSHASSVIFRGNAITSTAFRAIKVTEMSDGLVAGNTIEDVTGAGLYCGDMSHCEFRDNVVRGVASDGSGVPHAGGYGAVAYFHATMRVHGSTIEDVEGGRVGTFGHASTTEEFPLPRGWALGWGGAFAGLGVAAASIAGLLAVWLGTRRLVRGRSRRFSLRDGALVVLLWGFAVQTFHMLEHGVQVFQVYVANSTQRQGLLGQHVDAEWVHLTYNAAVLAFIVWALVIALPGRSRAREFLLAAGLIQTYHVVEHVAKVVQHVAAGVNPAPGLLGARAGLVWFHFGINLAVYAGIAIAIAIVVRTAGAGPLRALGAWIWPRPRVALR